VRLNIKNLVALYVAIKRFDEPILVPYSKHRGRYKINSNLKDTIAEVSFYSTKSWTNRLVAFYLVILVEWGLIKCENMDKLVIK
jgi:hypothetical protein